MDEVKIYQNQQGEDVWQSASHKVLLVMRQAILLVPNEKDPSRLTIPGGRNHIGEKLQRTLEREFLEETGIQIKLKVRGRLLARQTIFRSPVPPHDWCDITYNYYLCQAHDSEMVKNAPELQLYPLIRAIDLVTHAHEKEAVRAAKACITDEVLKDSARNV